MKKRKAKPCEETIMNNSFDKFHVKSLNLTEKQKRFFSLASDKNCKIVFVSGPAGSSKTYISVYSALRLLSEFSQTDLIYIRTIIESADKGLGALPGGLEDKFNPYMIPLLEKLNEMLPANTTTQKDLLAAGRVDAMPINFLRGVSWNDKIIIMDEAQNATFKELTTLITRIGEGSRLFICGDLMQSDINGKSGFGDMMKLFDDERSSENGIHCFRFNSSDIKRSKVLKYIISRLEEQRKAAEKK
jgi:phosphate starvation-inducible protein PhoH and related proteins